MTVKELMGRLKELDPMLRVNVVVYLEGEAVLTDVEDYPDEVNLCGRGKLI